MPKFLVTIPLKSLLLALGLLLTATFASAGSRRAQRSLAEVDAWLAASAQRSN